MESFDVKLLKRPLGYKRKHLSTRRLHGDEIWVKDLDIVNELGGHDGCVNALSWSTSGSLLASGSDDKYLNIWEYNPGGQAKPFTLNTSVRTGHSANIFSVKFMPHSNDRTVVTCAGDSEVRVFDLEYAAGSQAATGASESTRSGIFHNFFGNCKWLTDANTNARVYRSHADRAKRIVTESSPHLFLTCSEDGEVRQWDLRQPSSAYPSPRESRIGFRRLMRADDQVGDVPPPLISYKDYGLELNTISCSKSQPHYIALGGAHLHCFLHDRRMLGRDLNKEHGKPTGSKPQAGTSPDESMREATRCVKRFAPNNKRKMLPGATGHITACKISDARPNELISSWSGDHVYSFDIVRGPDARDLELEQEQEHEKNVMKDRAERKRKRSKLTASTTTNGDGAEKGRRLKRVSDAQTETGQTALRLHHDNGSSESAEPGQDESVSTVLTTHEDLLSEAQKVAERIAKAVVDLRKTLFDFAAVLQVESMPQPATATQDLTANTPSYTKALGQASVLLPQIEDTMRTWTYPNTTDEDEILLQNTLRRNRQSTWRYVQATGCLAKTLGGKLQTASSSDTENPALQIFETIKPAALEGKKITDSQRFCYDFAKAINLWLSGGTDAVLQGFKRPVDFNSESDRFPFDTSTELQEVPQKLSDYLLPLADEDKPIIDLGTNKFERDELRRLFENQRAAVIAFTRAMSQIQELRMHHGTSDIIQESSGSTKRLTMDKGAAARFWGEKVCRALLMDAAEGVTYNFVSRAFGGLRIRVLPDDEAVDRLLDDVLDEDSLEADFEMTATSATGTTTETERLMANTHIPLVTIEEAGDEHDSLLQSVVQEEYEDEDDDNVGDESADEDSDSDSEAEEDEPLRSIYRNRRPFGMPHHSNKASVNNDIQYTSHTKTFKGHCNTRTVKDVNYYGPNDEYVVSGSDDGNFFIWDRKTTKIVNVLEGDGEVVNVIQGHPYEPMIACSGIDSTIKIFGPAGDNRERYHARQGTNIAKPGGGQHSSLRWGTRRLRRRYDDDDDTEGETTTAAREAQAQEPERLGDDPEKVAKGGLKSRKVPMEKVYEITSQNNAERRRGMGDAFMTQGMLARLLLAAQNGELQGIEGIAGGQGFGGAGGTLVVDENCTVM